MSFDTREASVHDGAPVLLFEFSRGPAVWRYTNCGVDYTLGGIVYTDVPGFTDDTISQSGDATRDAVNLVVPASLGVVSHYLQSRPTTRMRLVICSVHFGDTATADAEIEWIGYVVGISLMISGRQWPALTHQSPAVPSSTEPVSQGLKSASSSISSSAD